MSDIPGAALVLACLALERLAAPRASIWPSLLVGAAIGEWLGDRDAARAAHVGVSTWLGLGVGTVAKIAITFVMVGLFVAALLVG
ncbi:MAG: DUF456 family protein [bacterium]